MNTAICHSRARHREGVVGFRPVELPIDRTQAEIDAGFGREFFRCDCQRIERGEHARLGFGVEGKVAALLDQGAGQRLARALRQLHFDRPERPSLPPSWWAERVSRTPTPAQGCSDRSRVVWPTPLRVRACGNTSGMSGGPNSGRPFAGPPRKLALKRRARIDDAIIVFDLVAQLQRAADLRLRILAERDDGARSGIAVNDHVASPPMPRKVAEPCCGTETRRPCVPPEQARDCPIFLP